MSIRLAGTEVERFFHFSTAGRKFNRIQKDLRIPSQQNDPSGDSEDSVGHHTAQY